MSFAGAAAEVACFQSMDPSQLAFIKQLILDAEAKHNEGTGTASTAKRPDPPLDTSTPSAPHDARPTADSTEMESKPDPTTAENKAPPAVPIATPCRAPHPPAPTGTSEAAAPNDKEALPDGENSGQPSEKLKQFWSKFVVSPQAGNSTSTPQAKAPRADVPTPATTALDSTTPERTDEPTPAAPERTDEPMPPAPSQALPVPEPLPAREQIRTRLMKLDSQQYGTLIEEATAHPLWSEYFQSAKQTSDELEDMINWIMYRDQQQQEQHALLHKPTLILGEPDPDEAMVAPDPAAKPTEPAPTQPNIHMPTAVPTATPDCVQAALLRATTVDLNTPLQTAAPVTAPAPEEKQHSSAPADAKPEAKEETKQTAQQAFSTPGVAAKPSEPAEPTPEELQKRAAKLKVRAIRGKFHRSIRSA